MELDAGLVDLLYVVGGAVVALAGNWVWSLLKKRPDYDEIESMTLRMVEAAQQMSGMTNEERYDYVTGLLSKWLQSKGWNIGQDLIEVFVESAVRFLRSKEKLMGVDLNNYPEEMD